MPSWPDIRPAQIYAQLPIVWSYKFDRKTGKFTGRLAGDRITQIFGKSFRGLPLAEAQPPEAYPSVYALCERVVMEPALYRRRGPIFKHLGRPGYGERIMLPLSSDGVLGDGILGATEYRHPRNGGDIPIPNTADGEEWLPLV
jgi:hypothetical protein